MKQWFQSLSNEVKAAIVTLVFMIWFVCMVISLIVLPIVSAILCSIIMVAVIACIVWSSLYCLFEWLELDD